MMTRRGNHGVHVAGHAGFCFGVKRLIDLVQEALTAAEREGRALYGLGWPVHNEVVVARLQERGLRLTKNLDAIPREPGTRLLLRAHGEPLPVINAARERDLIIVDASCPLVERVRDAALRAAEAGRSVLCVGDQRHPEVRGILSCVRNGKCRALAHAGELPEWPTDTPITVLPQTTVTRQAFEQALASIRARFPDTEMLDLRCNVIDIRQREAVSLASDVDHMVVVGSERSSNTRHLFDLVSAQGSAVRVTSAAEIEKLPSGVRSVGVTAGASTPFDMVEAVVAHLEGLLLK